MKRIFAIAAVAALAACGGGDKPAEGGADTMAVPAATDTAMAPAPAPMDTAAAMPAPMDTGAMAGDTMKKDSGMAGDTTKKM